MFSLLFISVNLKLSINHTVNFQEGFIFTKLPILTLHMRSFVKIKSSRNVEISLSFTDVGNSCLSCEFEGVANMSFNAICEN